MTLRALISVSDKSKIDGFAGNLVDLGWQIFSTGGTRDFLNKPGRDISGVEDLTGFPEILGGRVKTLHPLIYGGILARRGNPDDANDLEEHAIETIDLVAVNLYPFVESITNKELKLNEALEQIDIGGVTLLRAAAKNFPSVLVIVDPEDYEDVVNNLRSGIVPLSERRRLARKAFQHVSLYDAAIAKYLGIDMGSAGLIDLEDDLSYQIVIPVKKKNSLRYGENPHQKAALYEALPIGSIPKGISSAKQLNGLELSFNNILDSDAAWNIVCDFLEEPTVAIIKHGNPCGLASREKLEDAFNAALEGDTISAFGGIIASNKNIDTETATKISESFYEIVLAPGFDDEALNILKKKKNLRLLEMGPPVLQKNAMDIRSIRDAFLVQTSDSLNEGEWTVVTEEQPNENQLEDLKFAWKAIRHVKSNAIIIVKDRSIRGMGAGQPNRVISVQLAIDKAGSDGVQGGVLASDAFIPFADGLELALDAGIKSVVQPGGSIRDEEIIQAANNKGASMILTGVRHFRH